MFRRGHSRLFKWAVLFMVSCFVIAQFTDRWDNILVISAVISTIMSAFSGRSTNDASKSVMHKSRKVKKERSLFGVDPAVERLTNRVLARQHVSSAQQYYEDDDINARMRRKYNAENEARYQQYQYEKRAYRYPNAYDTQEAKNRAVRARTEANRW